AATAPLSPTAASTGPSPTGSPAPAPNLVFNGDAEAGAGATTDDAVHNPPGWTVTGKLTAVRYGAQPGYLSVHDPAPPDRGANYFAGGPGEPCSTAKETIDLNKRGPAIDGGLVPYTLAAYLGGYQDQDDGATVSLLWLDADSKELGRAAVGPVLAFDREARSGLRLRQVTGLVPAHTRLAEVVIKLARREGSYNDAGVDGISLRLTG
ncbi:MAG: hypothetical protein QOE92_2154, partial [Chloroflexota bacterium]|nr:hypothetical protein [Chloroflexota bacterium]